MTKACSRCERLIRNGDDIVAVVVSIFIDIPSKKTYAIEKPTECLDVMHKGCNDISVSED